MALGYVILITAQVGVWALLAPRSFYEDFPGFGRTWVSIDGPYNEHLVRDVGALNLALLVVLVAAFVRPTRPLLTVAAGAVLAWGLPHAAYHLVRRDGLETGDLVASLGGLMLFALVGAGLLWAARTVEANR